jgi:heat shock protein HtpX
MSVSQPPSGAPPALAPADGGPQRSLLTVPLDPVERRAMLEADVASMYRSTAAVLAVPVVIVALGLGLLKWWLGLLVLVVGFGAVVGVLAWRRAGAVTAVLNAMGARRLREGEYPRYSNLIEGLGMSSGVAEPRLYVVDDPRRQRRHRRRWATRACVVVTSGLLDAADRIALEAVLAQQVAHLSGGDAEAATAAFAFRTTVGWRHGLDRLLPARREELCDLNALDFTRYPPGMISALELVSKLGPAVAAADPSVAHFWMAAPDEFQVNNAAQVSIARRLALLVEL